MAYYGLVTLLHPYDSFQLQTLRTHILYYYIIWVKKTPAYYITNEG